MESNILIYNIEIVNKYYDYDWDDPRYDVNEKIKPLNKKYRYKTNTNDLKSYLECCLEEIGQNYCNDLLDTTLDDIIIYCEYIIITDNKEEHHKISYCYNAINSVKLIN